MVASRFQHHSASLLITLLLILLPDGSHDSHSGRIGMRLVEGISNSLECRNPLFTTHWYSEGGGRSQLDEKGSVRANLRLCPAYNGRSSCCPQSFEKEQLLYFGYWTKQLAAKLQRVGESKSSIAALSGRDAYRVASKSEITQYDMALLAHEAVLEPINHASCFAALLTYAAGMICFSCETVWMHEVETELGKVSRILVTDISCTELWANCNEFGNLGMRLKQAILDSKLATMQSTPLENLEMFRDQSALCDWAHDSIAMHPFTTPSEVDRESSPMPESVVRRLQAHGKWAYDAMKAGRASGFDITWAGVGSDLRKNSAAPPRLFSCCRASQAVVFLLSVFVALAASTTTQS